MSRERKRSNRVIACNRRKRKADHVVGDYIDPEDVPTRPSVGVTGSTFHFKTTPAVKEGSNLIFYIVLGVVLLSAVIVLVYFRRLIMKYIKGKKDKKEKKKKKEKKAAKDKGTGEKASLKAGETKATPEKESGKSKSKEGKPEKAHREGTGKPPRVVDSKLSGASFVSAPSDMLSDMSAISNENPSSTF